MVDTGSSWLKDALRSQGLLPLPSITEEKVLSSHATFYSTTLGLVKSWLAEKKLSVVERSRIQSLGCWNLPLALTVWLLAAPA